MGMATLRDGTKVHCIQKAEALVLDHHVEGYLEHGITIPPGAVVFDVGANIGIFGVRTMQADPDTQVYAFEPIPSIFEVLSQNAKTFAKDRFHTFPFGLSDQPGELRFVYFPHSPALSTAHPEMWDADPELFTKAVIGSIRHPPPHLRWVRWLPEFACRIIAKRLTRNREEVNCELRTLSQVVDAHDVERIDLLKIDCEGAEMAVLRGIREEHWPKIRQAVVEVHDEDGRLADVRTLLESHGLSEITIEKEKALEATALHNIYARRPSFQG